MFQRVGPKAFKKDLTNIVALSEILGRPETKFPSIHIAGTNGKGSVAHLLAAVFASAGFKTGLYTSPHYKDFRERIKVNGELIQKQQVIGFVEQNKQKFGPVQPSFFEWTVALAFDHFANERVDIAIIETGLGGRLDSTNIVRPLLSVITNIGYDHTNFLGETLPLIAAEKAGIIKAKTPVVIGETHRETAPVFLQKSTELHSDITFADQIYSAKKTGGRGARAFYEIKKNGKPYRNKLKLQHLGGFQKKNLPTLFAALEIFHEKYPDWFTDLPGAIENGLANLKDLTKFMGRWEYISQNPPVLVDSSHNAEGIKQTVEELRKIGSGHLHFVLGVVFDKKHDKTLALLPKNATYYFAKAKIPRGMDASRLQEQAAAYGLHGKSYTSVKRALAAAKKRCGKNGLIFVGGSIFVVAEVL